MNFFFRCFLRFLLKTVHQYHQFFLVEKAENSKYITSLLNPDFVKSVGTFNVLQVCLGDFLNIFYQLKCPDYLVSYFVTLLYKEVLKVVFVKYDSSILLFFHHKAKIANVVPKCNLFKEYYLDISLLQWFVRSSKIAYNVTGIATVADLRASQQSTATKPTRTRDRQTTTKPRYCWLYHVSNRFSIGLYKNYYFRQSLKGYP